MICKQLLTRLQNNKVLLMVCKQLLTRLQNNKVLLMICKQLLTRLQNNKVSYEGSEIDGITTQFGLKQDIIKSDPSFCFA